MRLLGLLGHKGPAAPPPPAAAIVYARDDLSTLLTARPDLAGLLASDGISTWRNIATNTMAAALGPPKNLAGTINSTALYVCVPDSAALLLEDGGYLFLEDGGRLLLEEGGVGGTTPAIQEAVAAISYSAYDRASCGLILQSNGDVVAGSRYDCFIDPNSPYKIVIQRYDNGDEEVIAVSSLNAPDVFPINTTKTMGLRCAVADDGTFDLSVLIDGAPVAAGNDPDPLTAFGSAGIRGRKASLFYSFEHHSVVG